MRLIDADKLKNALRTEEWGRIIGSAITLIQMDDFIDEQPTVEAIPIQEHRNLCHEFYLQGKAEGEFEAIQHANIAHGR